MGTTFNARKDTYGQARRHSDQTVYVFDAVDLPTASGGEIALTTDLVYEIDKVLDLTDTLVCTDNTVRGDGSVNNRINWTGGVTALKQDGDFQIVIDDLTLEDDDDTCTLLAVTNATSAPGAAVIFKNGNVLRFWNSLGMVTQTRVNITETDIVNINGGFIYRNCPQVVMELIFFGFREPQQPPPDWLIEIYDDDTLSGQITRDVNLLNMRTNSQKTTNTDAAFFNLSPNINPNANILIAGCAKLGSNPCDSFVVGDESEITAYTDNLDGTITCSTPSTGSLANDDWINILRTENYNGGHQVSNVVANTSFDITATYVDNPGRGTWHSGSIDHRDPRLKARDNIGITRSRATMAMFENGNPQATTISTQDEWTKVEFSGLADGAPLVERFALCGPGDVAEFIYHGRDQIDITINCQLHIRADGQGAQENDFELAWGLNQADPTNVFDFNVRDLNALDVRDFIFNQAFIINSGDVLSLFVKCTDGTRDFIIEDIAMFAQEI